MLPSRTPIPFLLTICKATACLPNYGLINYIREGKRMLPCEAGTTNYFIEPYGDVYPCNGLEDKVWKESMGNIHDYSTFSELWYSEKAQNVRNKVKICPKNCWMVGTASPVIKKYPLHPLGWILKNKMGSIMGKEICLNQMPWYDVGQDPLQGDLNYSRMTPFTDSSGTKPDPALPLITE